MNTYLDHSQDSANCSEGLVSGEDFVHVPLQRIHSTVQGRRFDPTSACRHRHQLGVRRGGK